MGSTSKKVIAHDDILEALIREMDRVNFKSLAFPKHKSLLDQYNKVDKDSDEAREIRKKIDTLKVSTKHFVVLTVEQILTYAKNNHWNLCKNHDFIYVYNGEYWNQVEKERLQKFLGDAATKMGVDKFSSEYYQFKEHLFKQFMSAAYLPIPKIDSETVFVNLKNGTFEINLKGEKLREFKHSDFLTYQLPFEYNPESKSPIFDKYLNRVLPDENCQKVLAEYLGFVFIRHESKRLKQEKALILYGSGANGKSVFFEIVKALIGKENMSNYSLSSLTNESGYQRAKIGNVLVNYGSEINSKLESSLFKQLVSGEPVEARLPYGEPFTLTQYAKLIFNCNELPRDVEHTEAYFRRFLIVPFDVTIPPEERDSQLHIKIIEKELSGIFNWVLEGLHRLLSQKQFTDSKVINKTLEGYKKQSDTVIQFIDESGYTVSIDDYVLIKDLYPDYRLFCLDDGCKPVNKTNFKKRLASYNIVINRINIGNVAYITKRNP